MMRINSSEAVIIVTLAALVLCSVAGVAIFVREFSTAPSGKSPAHKGPTSLVSMGELVVNLADADQVRYLKMAPVLEVRGRVSESDEDEVKTRVRDAIIGVVSSKHFAGLIKPDGKKKLKKEIIAVVNERLDRAEVVNVYFNEFAMQ